MAAKGTRIEIIYGVHFMPEYKDISIWNNEAACKLYDEVSSKFDGFYAYNFSGSESEALKNAIEKWTHVLACLHAINGVTGSMHCAVCTFHGLNCAVCCLDCKKEYERFKKSSDRTIYETERLILSLRRALKTLDG